MIDLTTPYLGLELAHPLVPGAGPLSTNLDSVKQLEDSGAPAIVLNSLFEEQITGEQLAAHRSLDDPSESFAEATSYLPPTDVFARGPDEYLEHLAAVKAAVDLPVIGSLNGTTPGGWLDYARQIEQAGAAALELNVYDLPTDPATSGAAIEARTLELLREVVGQVQIPVAVKLSPYYSCLPHLARELTRAGAAGLVLFNRFYQPDIDTELLEVDPALQLSNGQDLLLRLRWLAILSPWFDGSLAATGGVHAPLDAVKAVMAGADTCQMVSSLLRHGPTFLGKVRDGLVHWLVDHEYESLAQMRDSMNLATCPDPSAYERTNYIKLLQTWRV